MSKIYELSGDVECRCGGSIANGADGLCATCRIGAASVITLAVGVDVVSTFDNSGEGRVEAYDADLAEPWGVRWDRTGRLGWASADMLRVVGRGVS